MRPNYYRIENTDGSTKDCYQNDSYSITMTRASNKPNEEVKVDADIFTNDLNTLVRQFINDLGETNKKMNYYKDILKTYWELLRFLVQSKALPETVEKQICGFIEATETQIFSQDTSVQQIK